MVTALVPLPLGVTKPSEVPTVSVPCVAVSVTVMVVSAGGVDGNGVRRTILGTRTATPAAPSRVSGADTLGSTPPDDATKPMVLDDESEATTTGTRSPMSPESL